MSPCRRQKTGGPMPFSLRIPVPNNVRAYKQASVACSLLGSVTRRRLCRLLEFSQPPLLPRTFYRNQVCRRHISMTSTGLTNSPHPLTSGLSSSNGGEQRLTAFEGAARAALATLVGEIERNHRQQLGAYCGQCSAAVDTSGQGEPLL